MKVIHDLSANISGRLVIVVEGIRTAGTKIEYVDRFLELHRPQAILHCALVQQKGADAEGPSPSIRGDSRLGMISWSAMDSTSTSGTATSRSSGCWRADPKPARPVRKDSMKISEHGTMRREPPDDRRGEGQPPRRRPAAARTGRTRPWADASSGPSRSGSCSCFWSSGPCSTCSGRGARKARSPTSEFIAQMDAGNLESVTFIQQEIRGKLRTKLPGDPRNRPARGRQVPGLPAGVRSRAAEDGSSRRIPAWICARVRPRRPGRTSSSLPF